MALPAKAVTYAASSFLLQQLHESVGGTAQQEIRENCQGERDNKKISPIFQLPAAGFVQSPQT